MLPPAGETLEAQRDSSAGARPLRVGIQPLRAGTAPTGSFQESGGAETRLAAAAPYSGLRGKSLNAGAVIAPVVKKRKCTNTSSQDFQGGGGNTNVPVLWSWFFFPRDRPGRPSLPY